MVLKIHQHKGEIAMTLQKSARFSRWFMGWFLLSFGLLAIPTWIYLMSIDHRPHIVIMGAMQIPMALFFVWVGAKRISELKRSASLHRLEQGPR